MSLMCLMICLLEEEIKKKMILIMNFSELCCLFVFIMLNSLLNFTPFDYIITCLGGYLQWRNHLVVAYLNW